MEVTMVVVAVDVRQAGQEVVGRAYGGQMDVLRIYDLLGCGRVPCHEPQLCVVVGLSANAEEFGRRRLVRVQIVSPEGVVIGQQEALYTVDTPSPTQGFAFLYPVFRFRDVLFPAFGPYDIRVSLDGELKADRPFEVVYLEEQA